MADYDRKELDEKIFCAKCNALVEETLLLTCDHNLCLPCAAKNLSREETKNIHKYKTVVCEICLNQTALDGSTANELMNMFPQYIRSMTTSNKSPLPLQRKDSDQVTKSIGHNSNMNINDSLLNLSVYSKTQNANLSMINSKREYCKEHGEELTYYCLDCLCKCICSECVVHGVHKNHEVMNVKRAYPLIVDKSEDLLYQVQGRIQEIANVQYSLDSKKKELVDNTNVIKQEMAQAFDEIRIRLQKKEKEIFDRTEVFLQEHLQELTTYSRVLQTKIISLNKLIDSINSNLTRKDEVNLLNFYSENKNRVMQTIESELPDIPDFNAISNIKVNVNQGSFDVLINSLNGIHMEITAMKGFEVGKVQITQKFAIKRDMYGSKNGNMGNTLNTGNTGHIGNIGSNYNTTGNKNQGNNNIMSDTNSYDYSKNNLVIK